MLRRVFAQNIDALSARQACRRSRRRGARLVRVVVCPACQREHSTAWFKAALDARRAPSRGATRGGLVKPDIVFYGEMLPDRFAAPPRDLQRQLLLVMGTRSASARSTRSSTTSAPAARASS